MQATECLLMQMSIGVVHPAGWKREGFPLPIKKMQPGDDGTTRQDYRPLAVLEYVQEVLSGETAAQLAAERKSELQP